MKVFHSDPMQIGHYFRKNTLNFIPFLLHPLETDKLFGCFYLFRKTSTPKNRISKAIKQYPYRYRLEKTAAAQAAAKATCTDLARISVSLVVHVKTAAMATINSRIFKTNRINLCIPISSVFYSFTGCRNRPCPATVIALCRHPIELYRLAYSTSCSFHPFHRVIMPIEKQKYQ